MARKTAAPASRIKSTERAEPAGPVLAEGKGALDVLGDGDDHALAEELRFGKRTERDHEAKERADQNAGHGERQLNVAKQTPAARAEIEGGFARVFRHIGEAEENRKEHEGEVDIDDAEDDRRHGIDQAARAHTDQRVQAAVEKAAFVEKKHPALKTDVLGNKKGGNDQEGEEIGAPAANALQGSGQRVADQEQDDHADQGQKKRPAEGDVEFLLDDIDIVLKRRHMAEAEAAPRHEAVDQDQRHRAEEAQEQQENDRQRRTQTFREAKARKRCRRRLGDLLFGEGGGEVGHSANSMESVACQARRTCSPALCPELSARSSSTRKVSSPARI